MVKVSSVKWRIRIKVKYDNFTISFGKSEKKNRKGGKQLTIFQ